METPAKLRASKLISAWAVIVPWAHLYLFNIKHKIQSGSWLKNGYSWAKSLQDLLRLAKHLMNVIGIYLQSLKSPKPLPIKSTYSFGAWIKEINWGCSNWHRSTKQYFHYPSNCGYGFSDYGEQCGVYSWQIIAFIYSFLFLFSLFFF